VSASRKTDAWKSSCANRISVRIVGGSPDRRQSPLSASLGAPGTGQHPDIADFARLMSPKGAAQSPRRSNSRCPGSAMLVMANHLSRIRDGGWRETPVYPALPHWRQARAHSEPPEAARNGKPEEARVQLVAAYSGRPKICRHNGLGCHHVSRAIRARLRDGRSHRNTQIPIRAKALVDSMAAGSHRPNSSGHIHMGRTHRADWSAHTDHRRRRRSLNRGSRRPVPRVFSAT
jgi:hypothetical protein